jgi:hypothetical protein
MQDDAVTGIGIISHVAWKWDWNVPDDVIYS